MFIDFSRNSLCLDFLSLRFIKAFIDRPMSNKVQLLEFVLKLLLLDFPWFIKSSNLNCEINSLFFQFFTFSSDEKQHVLI